MSVVEDKEKSKKLKLLLLKEVAVQKDCVRTSSASLQQRSVGCHWGNTLQPEMLSSWGSEAHALSQELLQHPGCLGQASLLSLFRYTLHIRPTCYIPWGGGFSS